MESPTNSRRAAAPQTARVRLALLILPIVVGISGPTPADGGGSADASVAPPPIAVRFRLDEPSFVTLVIERPDGTRVRNLVSETWFPAGDCVAWWDGLDDLGRDPDAARHGLYQIPARFVEPGSYRARGLARPPIQLVYEFSAYNAGSPPWETEDRRGGWLANHTPPSAVLFIPPADAEESPAAPAPRGTILVGSYIAEGGHGLAWLDLEGRKRYGQMWVGGVWTGASHLARDAGTRRVPGVYAYAGAVFEGGGFDGPRPELRLAELLTKGAREAAPRDGRFGNGWDRPLLVPGAPYKGILPSGVEAPRADGADFRYVFPDNSRVGLAGLAVHDSRLVASLPKMGQLLWVDAARRKIIGTVALEDPRGVAFDSEGRLLALSGKRLLRFPTREDPLSPGEPQVLVASGLEDPQGIALDPEGRIFVGDWGQSHRVKVFGPDGDHLRSIGTAGTPQAGPYDPSHMNHPKGITIDGEGRLWVAEEDFQPRRVSVWSQSGNLVTAFYGPSEYGGGGRIDPEDSTRFYYNGMEFRLDWERGTDRLVHVFHRPAPGDLGVPDGYGAGGVPEMPLYAGGRQYMTNCYNSNPTHGAPIALVWLLEGGAARPVAALGRANDWKVLKGEAFKSRWPAGTDPSGDFWQNQAMFVWSDLDGDAHIQPQEVRFWKAGSGGITVLPDLSFLAARAGDRVVRYRTRGFSERGVPLYDPEAGETLLAGMQPPASSGGDQALVSDDGWTIVTLGPKPFAPESLGGGRDGKVLWSYPSLWPGLHASHESPAPDRPGMLVGTTRLLGGLVRPAKGEAGPLWAVNGNMGNAYLFTADGLFVAELFRDVRIGKSWTMPEARRGMVLDGLSLHDENFWPTISGTADGRVYLVDGARTSIVRIDGLDGIRRIPAAPLEVMPEMLREAQAWNLEREAERQRARGDGVLTAKIRATPPAVDGKLDDWTGATWVTVDERGTAAFFDSNSKPYAVKAALAVGGDRLYAAFKTGDPDLLRNAGDAVAPFKTGGALDLLLGADPKAPPARRQPVVGDQRLLVTRAGGGTLAVHYRAVVPGTKDPVPFSSPWRTIVLDGVTDVSGQVQLAGEAGDYELSVPLSLLGLEPVEGLRIRGDIGLLRGNGFQTLARVYWNNKATGITSDVPSEAELTPHLWGELRFESASDSAAAEPIDRRALVARHDIAWDELRGQIPLGNGELCFNADATGLQTFGGSTMAHWGWHSFPLPEGWTPERVPPTGTFQKGRITGGDHFPDGTEALASWMFDNPHRMNLARLRLRGAGGRELAAGDVTAVTRRLDLWSGHHASRFTLAGRPVSVETCVHPVLDAVAVRIESPLLERGELEVALDFPYPRTESGDWVGDFTRDEAHATELVRGAGNRIDLLRRVDAVRYAVALAWSAGGRLDDAALAGASRPHLHRLTARGSSSLELVCAFSREGSMGELPTFSETRSASAARWESFWKSGGAVDLSGSKDPRWRELERRVVLSQYLMAVQSAGSFPPAECGLMGIDFWRGQFHMEMAWWHLAHYGLWDRWSMAEKALGCYRSFLPVSRRLAAQLAYKGAKWPKSVGPEGRSAPWDGNQVLLWKQPHPLFFAELEYRLRPTRATLEKWAEVLEETAAHMADYPTRDAATGRYSLVPAMPPSEQGITRDTVFDLAYWRWGLDQAQRWRERMGLARESQWDEVRRLLAPLPAADGLFVHSAEWQDTYARRAWEHPDPIGVLGMLPPIEGVDPETAHRTVLAVWKTWDWNRCWGWDFPWMAMAAARVGEPRIAVEALLVEAGSKNHYDRRGVNVGGPCPYLPGNGGLLYAIAMMAAGWDSPAPQHAGKHAPGFPDDGSWVVRWEGLKEAP